MTRAGVIITPISIIWSRSSTFSTAIYDTLSAHSLGCLFVGLKLLLFGRHRGLIHKEKLCSEQANPFGSIAKNPGYLAIGPYVCGHFDPVIIGGSRW